MSYPERDVNTPASLRSKEEVAKRCVVLYGVLAAGHGEAREKVSAWLKAEGLWQSASPAERAFLECETPTQEQRFQATWRAEGLYVLLWALCAFPALPSPTEICDVQAIQRALPPLFGSTSEWAGPQHLRKPAEIFDASDEIYEINWAVRDAPIFGKPIPNSYEPGVVQERHHALNWLALYGNADWDDVATDT